jgi:hypothetical protein
MLLQRPTNKQIKNIINSIKTNCIPTPQDAPIIWEKLHDKTHVAVWRSSKIPWDKIQNYNEPSKIFVIKEKDSDLNLIHKFSQNKCELIEIGNDFFVFRPNRKFQIPEYDFRGRCKVLLHDEGGYGDFFNGLRYLNFYPKVKWVCEARPSLYEFSKECGLFYDSIVKGEEHECDYHLSMDYLAKKHKHNSSQNPFIQIKPLEIDCGMSFCYKGNKVKKTKRREFNVNLIKHISKYKKMYNLQYDEPPIEWAESLLIKNWLDTAKIISASEFVITPSTAIAHLSGGLGKKTYVVISQDCTKYETAYFPNRSNLFYKNSRIIYEEQLSEIN